MSTIPAILLATFLVGESARITGIRPTPDGSTDFSKTIGYVQRAGTLHRNIILRAACESSAFTCDEILHFLELSSAGLYQEHWIWGVIRRWVNLAVIFTEGRNHRGCISDLANARSIADAFENKWRGIELPFGPAENAFEVELGALKQAFIYNKNLQPAKSAGPPPIRPQTGLRTADDMKKLLGEMKELSLMKYQGSSRYRLGSSRVLEFERWLKHIRANGEQFSGRQLVSLARAIPDKVLQGGTAEVVSVLLQYLEQYVTGITCKEVNRILRQITHWMHTVLRRNFSAALEVLKSNIVDGQNKAEILAATSMMGRFGFTDVWTTDTVLQDVGLGLPPKNNPLFGVLKGNPIVLVLDESTSMDAKFTLGDDTVTRRKFCHSQLERVLEGLPKGSYFNVIRYSSSTVKTFRNPVLISKTSINAAMEAVSWRSGFTPGQDPIKMLQDIRIFALGYKHPFNRSSKRNSMEALGMAYATLDLSLQMADKQQHTLHDREAIVVTKRFPQIYFLTSGQPDTGARHILDKIAEFDRGRNIPVNSIAFIAPADPARHFVKDLANKTGGFFRSIEHRS